MWPLPEMLMVFTVAFAAPLLETCAARSRGRQRRAHLHLSFELVIAALYLSHDRLSSQIGLN